MVNIFHPFQRFIEVRVPSKLARPVQKMLDHAGEEVYAEKWLGENIFGMIFFSIIYSLTPYLVPHLFLKYVELEFFSFLSLIIFLASLAFFIAIPYFALYFKIDARRSKSEAILPDFLSVVAMNITAGMEPLSALYISLRPDFNPITDEMKKLRSLSLGPESIVEQLSLLKKRIDSKDLITTVAIIERASVSGGDLANILNSVAEHLREKNKIKKELETATRGYVYFITFLAVIGVPLLLSVASIFIEMAAAASIIPAGGLETLIGIPTVQAVPLVQVDIIFIALIIFSSISASLMFGVLWGGEIRQGAKYAPILLLASILVYFVARDVIKSLLGAFGVL